MSTPGYETLPAARNTLLDVREDYDAAARNFTWPTITGSFNFAVDWLDVIARDNDGAALRIVEEDSTDRQYSYAGPAHRSDLVATWLAERGVGRGDRVLLMLGNQVEVWESMLAVMKLGAVIMPTTAVGPVDLIDHIERGGANHVLVNAAEPSSSPTSPACSTFAPRWDHSGQDEDLQRRSPYDHGV